MTKEKSENYNEIIDYFDEELVDLEWINKNFNSYDRRYIYHRFFHKKEENLYQPTMIFIFVLSLILLSLHLFINLDLQTIMFYPIHFLISSFYGGVIALFIKLYQNFRRLVERYLNNTKLQPVNDSLEQYDYMGLDQTVVEENNDENSKTHYVSFIKLSHHTNIPLAYRRKDVLDILLQYIKVGRALNEDEALKLFEQEYPDFVKEKLRTTYYKDL